MAKKLKFKSDTGLYRLNLTHTEVQLIAALVQQVRLGDDGDIYKDAALELCELFGSTEDFDCSYLDNVITIGSSVDRDGHTTIEAEEAMFESGCSGNCPGCSCGD
jgi:hypothetical protein